MGVESLEINVDAFRRIKKSYKRNITLQNCRLYKYKSAILKILRECRRNVWRSGDHRYFYSLEVIQRILLSDGEFSKTEDGKWIKCRWMSSTGWSPCVAMRHQRALKTWTTCVCWSDISKTISVHWKVVIIPYHGIFSTFCHRTSEL